MRMGIGFGTAFATGGGGGATPPPAPTIDSLDRSVPTQITVNYSSTPAFDSATVQCYLDAGLTMLQGLLGGDATNPGALTFTGLAPGTQYWFRAKVTTGGIDSTWSATANVTTLSNDTSLSTFTIDSVAVGDGDTVNKVNGTGSVDVVASPFDPNASRQIFILGSPVPGDNPVTVPVSFAGNENQIAVIVTAEDGVTTQEYDVSVHVLTAGVKQQTSASSCNPGVMLVTAGPGDYVVISDATKRYCLWANTGTETQPDASGDGATDYIEVAVSPSDLTGDATALAFRNALVAAGYTNIGLSNSNFIVEDATVGVRVTPVNFGICNSFSASTPGVDPS